MAGMTLAVASPASSATSDEILLLEPEPEIQLSSSGRFHQLSTILTDECMEHYLPVLELAGFNAIHLIRAASVDSLKQAGLKAGHAKRLKKRLSSGQVELGSCDIVQGVSSNVELMAATSKQSESDHSTEDVGTGQGEPPPSASRTRKKGISFAPVDTDMVLRQLVSAAKQGDLEYMRELLHQGVVPAHAMDPVSESTALMAAALMGHSHCVVELLQRIPVEAIDAEHPQYKMTAYLWAAYNGHLECVQALLAAGADPHHRDSTGINAAELARENQMGDFELVAAVAEQAMMQTPAVASATLKASTPVPSLRPPATMGRASEGIAADEIPPVTFKGKLSRMWRRVRHRRGGGIGVA
jgi:hypothetical protein